LAAAAEEDAVHRLTAMSEATRAVFLSYASQDSEAARRLCEALRATGVEVWFDQSELRGGDAWDAMIRKQVKSCALFVPVISAATNSRAEGYFRLEWKLAVDRSHLMADDQPFLLPVAVDATAEPDARVPDAFHARQWSRLTDDAAIAAFVQRVRGMLTGESAQHETDAAAPAAAPSIPPSVAREEAPSVAVLPFANRSSNPDDEYFAEGLADELLNVLAKIRGLHVAARASAQQFKGKTDDIATIGRKLRVSTVLEGTVRKSGNRVRIAVQLLKVSDGYLLWSETYDRTLDDIFAVQDDIASTVVGELREMLLGSVPDDAAARNASQEVAAAAKGRSTNPDAYRLYLQGNFLVHRMSAPDIARGIQCLQEAIALDPEFAQAHAVLSHAHTFEGGFGLKMPAEATVLAREAALRALALEPELVEGLLALAILQMWNLWDWAGARNSLDRALRAAPDNPEVLSNYGLLLYCTGRHEESAAFSRSAVERDPLNATAYLYLAFPLVSLGRMPESEAACRKALELSPEGIAFRYWLALVLEEQGRREEAIAVALQDKADWCRLTCLACFHFRMGRDAESRAMLDELERVSADTAAFQIAQVYAVRGEIDHAFAWLEHAFDVRDAGISMSRSCPWFDAIKSDPRWPAFLHKVGLAD
jgi:TolB-like protein